MEKDDKAVEYYTRIVKEYPSAEERSVALDALVAPEKAAIAAPWVMLHW